MKSYQRLLILLVVALAVTSLLSPWVAALWDSIVDARPEWERYRYSFPHIFGRLFMITGAVLVLSSRSLLRLQFLREAGLGPLRPGYRELLRGFGVAVASVAVIGILMWISKNLAPHFRSSLYAALESSGRALLTALTVGLFEEFFFRGLIFKGLLDDARPAIAFTVANLFYAAVHFVKPAEKFALSGPDPLAGIRFLIQALEPFLNPPAILPGLVGLFIIGVVLSYALLRTQLLYLSIGLHAGWVFGIKTLSIYGEFTRADLGWAFGAKPKIVSGVVSWIGIAAVGVVVHLMTRPHPNPLPRREREGRGPQEL